MVERKRVQITFRGVGRTKQSFAKECDINNIMKRYEKDGIVNHFNKYGGMYGDFTGITDYASAVERIERMQEDFMRLPASVRERFANDPGQLVSAAEQLSEEDFMRMTTDAVAVEVPPVVPAVPVVAAPVV